MAAIDITDQSSRLNIAALSLPITWPARTIPNKGINQALHNGELNELPPDTTPPVIQNISPPDSFSIDVDEELSFDVEDERGLSAVVVSAQVNGGPIETVYDLGGPATGYSVTPTGDLETGFHFVITRDAGWIGAVELFIAAVDKAGNTSQDGAEYAGPAADTTPPALSNFDPAPDSTIERGQTITFDITDDVDVDSYQVLVSVAGKAPEDVTGGSPFSSGYGSSSETPITGGVTLSIVRDGGWSGTVVFTVRATDVQGNELETSFEYEAPAAPTIENPQPDPGAGDVGNNEVIAIDVLNAARVLIVAEVVGSLGPEVVFDYHSGTYTSGYSGISSSIGIGAWRYEFTRVPYWNGGFMITVYAEDGNGNQSVQSYSWTAPLVSVIDVEPPAITNVVPPDGTSLRFSQSVSLDITDNSGEFRRIILAVSFPGLGIYEIVHDGDVFGPNYNDTALNSRVAIDSGFHYVLLRRGGWPASPSLRTFAIDEGGNEAE